MHPDTVKYNESLAPGDQEICDLLAREIDGNLPEAATPQITAISAWSGL